MIPIRLQLRNFMCYRDNVPPLLFEGFRLACLSGDNGNGKSALLDAITWALWGEARAKSDDELIHLGQTEMEVEFEFLLGDLRYRVVRKRTRPRSARGAGQTSLELQVESEGLFRPLTGNSVRETEQKIVELLRMPYQTFINSAFLLQGRADEFTTKSPADRKKVLADILGLAYYDALEDRAKQQARRLDQNRGELNAALVEIDRELERRPQYEAEVDQLGDQLAKLEQDVQLQEAQVTSLRERKHSLDLTQGTVVEIDGRLASLRRELDEVRVLEARAKQKLSEHSTLLADRERIAQGYLELRQLRSDLDLLSRKLSQYTGINERIAKVEQKIERVKGQLVAEQALLDHKVETGEKTAAALASLEGELATLQDKSRALGDLGRGLEEKRQQLTETAGAAQALRAANTQLRQEMDDLRDRLTRLGQGGEQCPLCGTALGVEGKQHIAENFRLEGQARRDTYRQNEIDLKRLNSDREALQHEVDALQAQLTREGALLQRREATLEKDIAEAGAAGEALGAQRRELAALTLRLAEGAFAEEERGQLALLKQEIAALGYDFVAHEEKRKRAELLEPFDETHRRLEEAVKLSAQEGEALRQAQTGIARRLAGIAAEEQRRAALQEEIAALAGAAEALNAAHGRLAGLQAQLSRDKQVFGAASQRLDYCLYLEKQKTEKRNALQKVIAEKAIYDELTVAFGKRGVQAMIIEAVIPEIEAEANEILGRMTDNRMTVKLETQRDTRKGDSLETLDIKIADELGTRNYELYSGGEAFRVNFAIRIALSKLLARRSGARLQLLVMDEGFGTQDSAGREKLIDALNAIQDDFEKILVITHIQELKDAFPIRIDVVKTPEGSTLSIS